MGNKTKGVEGFLKYTNSVKKKQRKPDEHDKAFDEIKNKSDKLKGVKVKTFNI